MMKKETRNEDDQLHSFNDEPAVIAYSDYNPKAWSYRAWYQNGVPHRLDGPAIEYKYGYKAWYQNGLEHRVDGPAVEYPDGEKEYWIEGEELTEQEFLARVSYQDGLGNPVGGIDVEHADKIKYRYTNEELHHLGARYFHIEGETVNEEVSLLAEAQAENDELKKDLQFFIKQSVIIEHKQDHKQLRKIRKKYGFDF